MRSAFRIFFGSEGSRQWLVLTSLMLASALEVIGIGVLLPLFSASLGGEQPWLSQIALRSFQAFGITVSTGFWLTGLCCFVSASKSDFWATTLYEPDFAQKKFGHGSD